MKSTYQISKTWAFWFQSRRFLKVFPMLVYMLNMLAPGRGHFGRRAIISFWPQGYNLNNLARGLLETTQGYNLNNLARGLLEEATYKDHKYQRPRPSGFRQEDF